MQQPKKRGRPKGSKSRYKCNCAEWAEIGSYFCPVHGNQNVLREKITTALTGGRIKNGIPRI